MYSFVCGFYTFRLRSCAVYVNRPVAGDRRIDNEPFIIINIINHRGISVGTITRLRNGRPRNRRTISRRRKLFLPLTFPPHWGPCRLPFTGYGLERGDCYTGERQSDRGVNLTKHLPLFTRFKNAWSYSFIPPLYLFRFIYCIVTTRNDDYFVHSFFLYFGKLT